MLKHNMWRSRSPTESFWSAAERWLRQCRCEKLALRRLLGTLIDDMSLDVPYTEDSEGAELTANNADKPTIMNLPPIVPTMSRRGALGAGTGTALIVSQVGSSWTQRRVQLAAGRVSRKGDSSYGRIVDCLDRFVELRIEFRI